MISPCIDVLRKLATQIHDDLGSRQGTKHTSPDLERDLDILVRSLKEHNVYGTDRVGDKEISRELITLTCVSYGSPQRARYTIPCRLLFELHSDRHC